MFVSKIISKSVVKPGFKALRNKNSWNFGGKLIGIGVK